MENLVTSILRKIDNLSSMDKAKSIKAELSARLIDSINNASFIGDDLTKRQLEKLIRNEFQRMDDLTVNRR